MGPLFPCAPAILALILGPAPTAAQGAAPQDDPGAARPLGPAGSLARLRSTAERVRGEIETLRGLRFKHPVEIQLADRAAFHRYAVARREATLGPDRVRHDQGLARLLGLIPGDADLEALTTEVLVEQVGGFYDPVANTFYILEGLDEDLARVIIAHEFTHALDDQYHDLDGTAERLAGNSDALLAHGAVVEGSGMELMLQWAAKHLSVEQRASFRRAQSELPNEAVASAPPYVWKPLVAIYYQGQAFLRRQARMSPLGQPARLDDLERAFQDPPLSTEQVLHPVKYWLVDRLDEPRQITLDVSALGEGWNVLLEDTLGELQAALLTTPFEERAGMDVTLYGLLGLSFTNEAATGWGGDRYVLLERDAGLLLHMSTRWDTIKDAEEFAQALRSLVPQIEASKASIPGYQEGASGLRVEHIEPDEVRVSSWVGLDAALVEAALARLEFSERGS